MKVLVLNSGSSSQKSCLYELADPLPESPPGPLWKGRIEWQGDRAVLETGAPGRAPGREELPVAARGEATARLLAGLANGVLADRSEISVVGHRIVNGGSRFVEPARITPEVK